MIRVLLVLALFFASNICFSDEIFIRLKPEVELEHLDVYLADIATVVSDEETLDRSPLMTMPIVKFKSLAAPVTLSLQDVEAAVAKYVAPEKITWGPVNSTIIRAKEREVDLSAGIDAAKAWLVRQVASQSGKSEFELVSNRFERMALPNGKIEQRPDFEKANQQGLEIRIPLGIYLNGNYYARRSMVFKSHMATQMQLELEQNTTQNSVKDEAYHQQKKESVQPVPNSYGGNVQKIDSAKEKQDNLYLINKNKEVEVIVREGAVQVESRGIALSDAKVGDELRVKRPDSKNDFIGHVDEFGRVIVGGE
jgi:hypothetical protein